MSNTNEQYSKLSTGELAAYVFENFTNEEIEKITGMVQTMPDYNKALEWAIKAHDGQYDKSGKPYVLHPINVSLLLESEDEKALALLHDIIEDTEYTLGDVAEWGFEHLTEALDCLSRRKGLETYREFIARICQNELAVKVKIADLKHNLSRIDTLPAKERGLKDRYMKWLPVLEARLKEMRQEKS